MTNTVYLAALRRELAAFEALPADVQAREPNRVADIQAEIARVQALTDSDADEVTK